jgi:hypothetical protein
VTENLITARVVVPAELWRQVRRAAIIEDRKNEEVLREALEAWLKSRNGGK